MESGEVIVAEKDVRNDVARPREGSLVRIVWDIADNMSAEAGKPATRGAVLVAAQEKGLNPATVATQFARWRKYNGLVSTPEERAARAAAKKAAREEKAAAKAAAKAATAEMAAKVNTVAPDAVGQQLP